MSGGDDPHDISDLDALRRQIEKSIGRGRGHLARYRELFGFPSGPRRGRQPADPPIRINAEAVLDTLLSLAPHSRRESDQEYFGRRSREEEAAAERAASGVASHIHRLLSRAYARLAAGRGKGEGLR